MSIYCWSEAKGLKPMRRREWTKADCRELKIDSKNRTPIKKVARAMKRTEGALRQKALMLGVGLGHRRCASNDRGRGESHRRAIWRRLRRSTRRRDFPPIRFLARPAYAVRSRS